MPHLPARLAAVILAFVPLFVHRSWRHARVLLVGAILAPGQRTVTSLLRVTGHARERRFVNYHRVLSRAAWCPLTGARILLGLLIVAFAPSGPVALALDDTIERRRGRRIAAKGIYRDPVRSSDAHFVKASGLRWMSLMLLAPIPWAGRVWALPFLTALVPSERTSRARGRRHRSLAANRPSGTPLAERTRPRARRRQRLLRPAVPRCHAPQRRHGDHAPAPRRGPLRAGPAPPARHNRTPAHEGRTPARPLAGPDGGGHLLADARRAGLVRRGRAHDRGRLGHRGLAARRLACRLCRSGGC
jgi:hypothetical protein